MTNVRDPQLAITASALEKRFGKVAALDGLDLEAPHGSVFGFLGPNGAGKTTALSILAGLATPTRGRVSIYGHDITEDGLAVRRMIGFLRQDPRFYTWMTGRETLQFTGRFFDMTTAAIDRRAAELLELVDLDGAADRKMGGYSGGMRQRLGIAQALMGNPRLLLLDEPCSALDPAGRREVIQIMERLRGSVTVFYSTHILQDVERVADEVAIVVRGKRVLQAPMQQLLKDSASTLTVEFEGPCEPLLTSLRRQPCILSAGCNAAPDSALHQVRLQVTDIAVARRALPAIVVAHDVVFIGCRPAQRSLEEIFMELTRGESGDVPVA